MGINNNYGYNKIWVLIIDFIGVFYGLIFGLFFLIQSCISYSYQISGFIMKIPLVDDRDFYTEFFRTLTQFDCY